MSGDKERRSEDKLLELYDRFELHEAEGAAKFDKLLAAQQMNADNVAELTAAVSTLVKDTEGIIQLHKDFQGTARVGKGVQNFMLWCLKWGLIGTGVVSGLNWLIEHFGKS